MKVRSSQILMIKENYTMRKKLTQFVFLSAATALLSLALTGCGKTTVTIEEMINAGKTENLFSQYTSFQIEDSYEGVDPASYYFDKDLIYVQFPEQGELYIGGEHQYLDLGGSLARVFYIDQEPGRWSREDNMFYENDGITEMVKTCEKKDGKLYVSTELSPEDSRKIAASGGFIYNDGEIVKGDYVLDAKTLAILSQRQMTAAADGTERTFSTTTVTYNVQRPDIAATMYEHATAPVENPRTMTVIVDPDTASEQTFTVQVPKGDSVAIIPPEEYHQKLFLDRACTEAVTGATDRNKDITVYLKKGA